MRKKSLYTLSVTIGSARVPRMDFYGLADPFVTLSVVVPTGATSAASLPTTVRTRTLKRLVTPVWNETFEFGVAPTEDVLVLKVWDEDTIKDDLVGLALLPVNRVPITRAENPETDSGRQEAGTPLPFSRDTPVPPPAAAPFRGRSPSPSGHASPSAPVTPGAASSSSSAAAESSSPVQPGIFHQSASREPPRPPRVLQTTLELFKPRKRGVLAGLGRLTVSASVREEIVELLEEEDLAEIEARVAAHGGAGGGGVGGRRPEVLEKRFLGIGELAMFLWANEGHSRGLRANWQVRWSARLCPCACGRVEGGESNRYECQRFKLLCARSCDVMLTTNRSLRLCRPPVYCDCVAFFVVWEPRTSGRPAQAALRRLAEQRAYRLWEATGNNDDDANLTLARAQVLREGGLWDGL